MTTDLTAMTYTELMTLEANVKLALEKRKADEEAKAKKEWLTSEAAQGFVARIEELRKSYNKLGTRCKPKAVTLKVKMTVDVSPNDFEDLLSSAWAVSLGEAFDVKCTGELLNSAECGTIADSIQSQVDCVMDDVCEEAMGLNAALMDDLEGFVNEYNEFTEELNKAQSFRFTPSDLLKAKKGKKGKK